MMPLKKRRRVQVILIASAALVLSTALIGYAMRDGINFFRSPSQLLAEPPAATEVFRIGGLVEEGSLVRGHGETVSFRVTDGGASVLVTYTGILPDLFEEGEGMVGQGRWVDGIFQAHEVLARHDETYMPAEVADALKAQGVYMDPVTGERTDGAGSAYGADAAYGAGVGAGGASGAGPAYGVGAGAAYGLGTASDVVGGLDS
jgi:cytochrome c-type biogenesis protein CcmE